MFKRLCLTVVALTVGFGLTACGESVADRDDLVEALVEDGRTEEEANCIADALYDEEFRGDDDTLKAIADADDAEDLPPAVKETVDEVVEDCTSG